MHRSSESVAGLATALAKAQMELINPEKSLIANIRSDRRGETNQSFRYAPLSSGLDIIRKTLGRHEIAVMQTTAVDATSGMVNLNTLLAHTSGDWISSDWPVCPMSDVSAPHRMGAALTYARRYALFALVGIAGDDDLDAPNLNIANGALVQSESSTIAQEEPGQIGTAIGGSDVRQKYRKQDVHARRPILAPAESAELSAQLLTEIMDLSTPDAATSWARRTISVKNQLTKTDAEAIEQAFAARMTTIGIAESADYGSSPPAFQSSGGEAPQEPSTIGPSSQDVNQSRSEVVVRHDRLSRASPRRRDKAHLRYVATQACLVCGREPSDPHHLRFAQLRALGRKVSDEYTVPLCRSHHRELHSNGKERNWWHRYGIDPLPFATRLWGETHGIAQRVALNVSTPLPAHAGKRIAEGNKSKAKNGKSNPSIGANGHDIAKTD